MSETLERPDTLPEEQEFVPESYREEFRVTDLETAAWVVDKITAARAKAARIQEQAEAMLRDCAREEEFFLNRYGADLAEVAATEIERTGGKKKSLKLLTGTVGFRSAPRRLDVVDEDAARQWAQRECPDAVKVSAAATGELGAALHAAARALMADSDLEIAVTESLLKTPLNDHLKDTGEVPPGCDVAGGEERFYVK